MGAIIGYPTTLLHAGLFRSKSEQPLEGLSMASLLIPLHMHQESSSGENTSLIGR